MYPYDPPEYPQVPQAIGATILTATELDFADLLVIINAGAPAAVTTLQYLADFLTGGGLVFGASGLTATGTTQATAFPIEAINNQFSNVPPNSGMLLPPYYYSNQPIRFINRGAHLGAVYPYFGDQIEAYGVNVPVGVTAGGGLSLVCFDPLAQAQPRTWWIVA